MYYVYETTNNVNSKTYVGERHCPVDCTPASDSYLGSGTVIGSAIKRHSAAAFSKLILITTETRKEALDWEVYFIARNRRHEKCEYNIADGGEGVSSEVMRAIMQRPEVKAKKSEAQRRVWLRAGYRESRANINKSEEFRQKMRDIAANSYSEENALKASLTTQQLWQSEAYRKAQREGLLNALSDPAFLEAKSAKTKKLWQDPAYRASHGKPLKACICVETGVVYESPVHAAQETGFDAERIRCVCSEGKGTTRNTHWKYVSTN